MSNEKFAMKGPYRIGVDIGGTFTDLLNNTHVSLKLTR